MILTKTRKNPRRWHKSFQTFVVITSDSIIISKLLCLYRLNSYTCLRQVMPLPGKNIGFQPKKLSPSYCNITWFSSGLQMFLLFFPRQHVETLKEAKMRDGNFCLQTRLQGKICGLHLIRAESTYMLDGGYFCFCLY